MQGYKFYNINTIANRSRVRTYAYLCPRRIHRVQCSYVPQHYTLNCTLSCLNKLRSRLYIVIYTYDAKAIRLGLGQVKGQIIDQFRLVS